MSLSAAVRPFLDRFLHEPLRRIDREQRDFLASDASQRPDWKVATVLVVAAIVLTLQHFYADLGNVRYQLRAWGQDSLVRSVDGWLADPTTYQLRSGAWWALFSVATYFVVPWLVIALAFGERLSDYGCKVRGAFADGWIYVVFFCIMGPLLLWVSTHQHFQDTYPFYKLMPGERLGVKYWSWEMLYFLQFFGLEFFFRGFMVHGTKHRFGVYSIYVMAVPYCMIHFSKPLLEALAAIIAGVALGFMSLKNRSIWLGAAIHMTVAVSMDMMSLWRQGYFD